MNTNKKYENHNTSEFHNARSYIIKKKNLILGAIEKYSWETVAPFFISLLKANISNYDCVIFVRLMSEDVINKIKECEVIIHQIPEKYQNESIINIRWKMYFNYLNERNNQFNLVFAADVRDTIFQKDIFEFYEKKGSFLGVPIEDGTLQEKTNKDWIIEYCDEELYESIKHERIICVGTIWGTPDKFKEFSSILYNALSNSPKSIEQGVANFLFYHKKIFNNCMLKSDNYGPIMTIGLTKKENLFLDPQNNLLNFDNEIAAVVHQYDRKPHLRNLFKKKFCPEDCQYYIKINNYFYFILYLFLLILLYKLKIHSFK